MPLSGYLDPRAMKNKDITIGDNSNRQQAIQNIDEVTVEGKKQTEIRILNVFGANPQDSYNIGNTKAAISDNQLVEEGHAVLVDGVDDEWDVQSNDRGSSTQPK